MTVEWRDVARFSIQGLIFSPSHFSLFQEHPSEGSASPPWVVGGHQIPWLHPDNKFSGPGQVKFNILKIPISHKNRKNLLFQ